MFHVFIFIILLITQLVFHLNLYHSPFSGSPIIIIIYCINKLLKSSPILNQHAMPNVIILQKKKALPQCNKLVIKLVAF